MVNKRLFFVIVFVLLISISSIYFSQAAILLQNPNGLYNLGNSISVTSEVTTAEQFNGFFRVELICFPENSNNNRTELIYLSPIYLQPNNKKEISFEYLAANTGKCYFKANLEQGERIIETAKTENFKISDIILLALKKNKEQFKPGEEIIVEGSAVRDNGELFDGNLIIDFGLQKSVQITDGKFKFSLNLDKNIESYSHSFNVTAIDASGNNGNSEVEFYVIPVPSLILINSSNQSFIPEETAIISANLYDQANGSLDGNLTVVVYYDKKILAVSDIPSGNMVLFKFEWNALPGEYNIESFGFGLTSNHTINLIEHYELLFNLTNGTLTIKNIGNVKYDREVFVLFNMTNQNKTYNSSFNVNLDVGKSSDYVLEAPQGNYTIELVYPTEFSPKIENLGTQILTGSVVASINLEERKESINFANYSIIFLALIILVILLIMGLKSKTARQIKKEEIRKYYVSPRPKNSVQQTQSISKPRVFEPKITTNSLKTNLEKERDRAKLREEAKPFIERALRK